MIYNNDFAVLLYYAHIKCKDKKIQAPAVLSGLHSNFLHTLSENNHSKVEYQNSYWLQRKDV